MLSCTDNHLGISACHLTSRASFTDVVFVWITTRVFSPATWLHGSVWVDVVFVRITTWVFSHETWLHGSVWAYVVFVRITTWVFMPSTWRHWLVFADVVCWNPHAVTFLCMILIQICSREFQGRGLPESAPNRQVFKIKFDESEYRTRGTNVR